MKHKRIWISSGVLLLTLISTAAFLVSETGLRWIINTAAQQVPGTLQVRAIHGSLLSPITLEGIHYQSAQNEVNSERVSIEWSPGALLKAHLHIRQLQVADLSIRTSPAKAEPPTDTESATEFSGFSIPFGVELDDIQINNIVYQDANGKQIPVDKVSLSAHSDEDKLIIQSLEILSPQGNLAVSGLIHPDDLSVDLDTRWRLTLEEQPTFEGNGKLNGNLMQARLQQNLTMPVEVALDGSIFDVIKKPHWQANIEFDALNPQLIRADLPALSLTSRIKGQGDLSQLQLNMNLQTRVEQYGEIKIDSTINGAYTSPWVIEAFSLQLPEHDMRISATGKLKIENNLPTYSLNAHWENLAWPIQDAAMIKSPRGQAQISGSGMLYQIITQADIEAKDFPPGKVEINGQGTDELFSLESAILSSQQSRISAKGGISWKQPDKQGIEALTYKLDGHWQDLAWPLTATPSISSQAGQFEISGAGMQYQLMAQADIAAKDISQAKVAISGQGTDEMFNLESASLSAGKSNISAKGQVGWKQADKEGIDALTYTLDGQWKELTWPLNTTPNISSQAGRFELSGTGADYQTTVNADLSGQEIPESQISISGNGSQETFTIQTMNLATLNGTIDAQGSVSWLPEISWQANLKAQNIDPSGQWPEWQGKLNAEFDSRGSFNNKQLAANVEIKQLSGDLRGFPVEARAKLEIANNRYYLPELFWRSGSAEITAQGKLDEQWDMEWSAHADDMAAIHPDLSGQFSASGKLSGQKTKPQLAFSLSGNTISFREIKLGELEGNVQLDATDSTPSQINLQLKNVSLNDWSADSAQLITEGMLAKQHWQIAITRAEETLDLELDGGYQASAWQGELQTLQLATAQAGTWILEKPAQLQLSPAQAKTTNLCLRSAEGNICVEADWQAEGSSNIKSVFNSLSTSLAAPFLPELITWQDSLSGQLDASIDSNKNLRINSNMQLGPGSVVFIETEEEILKLDYEQGEITAQTDANGTQVIIKAVLNQEDQLNATIRLPDYTSLSALGNDEPIAGHITGSYRNLGLISLFVPKVQDLSGLVSLDITLDGSLGNPRVTGGGMLIGGRAAIPDAGLKLTDLNLELISNGSSTLIIKGGAHSGDGSVTLNGDVTLDPQTGWPAHLELKGTDFEVLRRPGQWILASPDITVDIKDQQINVQGTVAIPRTDIEIKGIPESTITASSDVIITQDQNDLAVATGKGWTVVAELRVLPGENVRFGGFGLTGRAQGDLTLTKALGKNLVGTGNLEIVEGKYRAFGTELSIEQGQLIFANSPVDNPAIDLRATRTIETDEGKIIVGLRAQGRLKAATLTLFSEPAMDETNLLSYLLLGRPASERSDSDSDLLIAAATAIGTSEAFVAAKRLAQSLGFEDAQVNRSGLVLGKSLSPRLYLSYEIGLLQPQNTLQLRYTLTDRWAVKVKTGEYDSTDLIFTIER